MKRILILLIAMTMLVAGCKKKDVKKSSDETVKQCTSLQPFLAGKYIPNEGSSDTVYIDFRKNLCPGSVYNEYLVRNYDIVVNKKAIDPVPWKNFVILSSIEGETQVFAHGEKLVISLSYNNGRPVISTVYDNRLSNGFLKVQP